jgi:hypothetical protein
MNSEQNNKIGSIKKGIWLVVLGHIICIALLFAIFGLFLGFLILWLVQIIYVIPMAIYFEIGKKEAETVKGVLISSGITFLLSFGTSLAVQVFKIKVLPY